MSVYSGTTGDVGLTVSGSDTAIQLKAGSTKRVKLVEWGISFEGTTATDAPVDVSLVRQSTDGDAGTSITPVEWDEGGEAALATMKSLVDGTQPTTGDILGTWQITPNGGLLVIQYPFGREPVVAVSGRIALITTVAVAVDSRAYFVFEE